MSALRPARRRASLLGVVLLALVVATALATLSMGNLGVAPADLPRGFAEVISGEAKGKANFVLGHLRGPRLVVALGAGAALGASGALFQAVTRNPLGSPDVIGLSSGAYTGVIVVLMVGGSIVVRTSATATTAASGPHLIPASDPAPQIAARMASSRSALTLNQ